MTRLISILVSFIFCTSPAWADRCGDAFVPISEIQGAGERSPLAGQYVAVEGLIAGVFLGGNQLSGVYLTSAAADADDRVETSEGLFVHMPSSDAEKAVDLPKAGERVRVRGRVREYHDLTELASVRSIEVCAPGEGPPPAQALHWPLAHPERQEGMLVEAGPLKVVEQRELERYGSLRLAPERLLSPTQSVPPGPAAKVRAEANSKRSIILDDGSTRTYPDHLYELSWKAVTETGQRARPIRLGDRSGKFRAILDFRFGEWRLQPVDEVALQPSNRRPEPLAPAQGLRLVAFNLGNFFNGNGRGSGFPSGRGADSRADYLRQKAALVALLSAVKPDVIAVAEVENDGYGPDSAIAALARGLGTNWRYVDYGKAHGSDVIANGILYDAARLTRVGETAVLGTGAFARGNRPALAAAFRTAEAEDTLTIVANHFKSKRCNSATGVQADQSDGQACWAALRVRAASEIIDWLEADPTGTGANHQIVMGDLNSYRREAPLLELDRAGFLNPSDPDSYSYSYDGEVGTLDYILVPAELKKAVLQTGTWAANVDEPYNPAELGPQLGEPWRASDHDPVWLDLKWPLP